MADGVDITPGTGATVATDDAGAAGHVQIVKLAIGTDGSAAVIPADATNGLLVDVKRVQGQVQIGDGTDAVAVTTANADDVSNTTNTLETTSRIMLFDGVGWDRAKGDSTNGQLVDVSRIQGQVQIGDGTDAVSVTTANADNESNTKNTLDVTARLMVFDGTTWDRAQVDTNGGMKAAGCAAHDAVDSGAPVKIGGQARSSLPTAVASADRANMISDVYGRQLTGHIDAGMQVWKSFNATSAQTGIAVWTPTAGKKVVVTSIVVGTYGTTAGRCILWFGATADTTYNEGTDQAVLKASFAPSATGHPGLVFTPQVPVFAVTADHVLRITTDAALSIDLTVYGYEI